MTRPARVLAIGWFGERNLGDEAMLEVASGERPHGVSGLNDPEVRRRMRTRAFCGLMVGIMAVVSACAGPTPGSTTSPTATPTAPGAPGASGGAAGPGLTKATLHAKGSDGNGDWDVEGPASPIDTIIAGPWSTTVPSTTAGYTDQATLTISGTVAPGTRPTSTLLSLEIAWLRDNPAGTAAFDLDFVSTAGECQITMSPGAPGQAGSFTCTGLVSDDGGHTISAEGTFAQ